MSGSDDKFALLDEASIKYGRLNRLFERLGKKPDLPKELAQAISEYEKQGAISNSINFIGALSKDYDKIAVQDSLKGELQRIATWSEWKEFAASPEDKAQLSADRIHLFSTRFSKIICG